MTQVDTDEFAEFYSANFHQIAGQLSAYLGDHAEAQDLTQEAFCRALDRWESIRGYGDPAGWVRRVAWNLATSRLRHVQVANRHLRRERLEHVEGPGPERVALTQALASLPANHRLAVVLHHLGHLSTSEIAQQQGVAEGTVRSWLSRGRSQLAEYFVEKEVPGLQAAASNFIQAPGVAQAVEGVRKRRTARRAGIAALAALLVLVIPLVIVLSRASDPPPVIGPTTPPPTISPQVTPSSPALNLKSHKLAAHGAPFTLLPTLYFAGSNAVWALYEYCASTVNLVLVCDYALDFSSNRGLSWAGVTLPTLGGSSIHVYFIDERTFTVQRLKEPKAFYLTTNGGASYISLDAPPTEATRARLGEYHTLCPGATGFEDEADAPACTNAKLHKAGSGQIASNLPLHDQATRVINGGDGRLWLTGNSPKVFSSQDKGRSWQEVTAPEGAPAGNLQLSPDGKEVWIEAKGALAQLTGQTWINHDVAAFSTVTDWAPVGNGAVVLTRPHLATYYKDGVETPIWAENPSMVRTVGDTVVISDPRCFVVAAGVGRETEWTMIEP